ncbi:unnamed protein product, partial [Ilex paraguariensis]
MTSVESSQIRGSSQFDKGPRRMWTTSEESLLINVLKDICNQGWKSQNGAFRSGYLHHLEKTLTDALSGNDLRATPHIELKIKNWKKTYNTLVTMPSTSGFGWNDAEHKIDVEGDDVWAEYVKVLLSNPTTIVLKSFINSFLFSRKDSNAKGMREKSWSYYNGWSIIFGKDRATGEYAKDLEEMIGGNDAGVQVHDTEDAADTDVNMADTRTSKSKPQHGVVGQGDTPTSRKQWRKTTGEASDGIARNINKMTDILGDYVSSCGKQLSNIAQRVHDTEDAADTDVNMADTRTSKSKPQHGVVGQGDTPTSRKQWRKTTGEASDGIARNINKMMDILGDYVSSCGKQLSNIAQRVGYKTTYKISSDPIKVDLFMSLPENERPAWLLGV